MGDYRGEVATFSGTSFFVDASKQRVARPEFKMEEMPFVVGMLHEDSKGDCLASLTRKEALSLASMLILASATVGEESISHSVLDFAHRHLPADTTPHRSIAISERANAPIVAP